MLCAIWYHLCNLKYVKNTHGRVILLVKLPTIFCWLGDPALYVIFFDPSVTIYKNAYIHRKLEDILIKSWSVLQLIRRWAAFLYFWKFASSNEGGGGLLTAVSFYQNLEGRAWSCCYKCLTKSKWW